MGDRDSRDSPDQYGPPSVERGRGNQMSHVQLKRQRGLKGSTPPGPASLGRTLSGDEKAKLVADLRARGIIS